MSWSISVGGHESDAPDPESVKAVAKAAIAAAREQGLTPTYGSASPGGPVELEEEAGAETRPGTDTEADAAGG